MSLKITRQGYAVELGSGEVLRACDVRNTPPGAPAIRAAEAVPEGTRIEFEDNAVKVVGLEPSPRRLVLEGARVLCADAPEGLGLIDDGAVVISGATVTWVGARSEMPASFRQDAEVQDLQGRLLTPGLVDCHAHPIFAGDRSSEFARRARGESYLEIAKGGGGIASTVQATRTATSDELIAGCAERLADAMAWGTTTSDAKSGYELTVDGELRSLRVAQAADAKCPMDLCPTLLGAHVVPPEYRERRSEYVREVSELMVPKAALAGLASAVDVYCDEGAFTLDETREILEAGRRVGLGLRAHVGQFRDLGGPELLAELGARSGDHLEVISSAGMNAMAQANVSAVLLPGACVQLRQQPPPIGELRNAGVRFALGSDLNPGSSFSANLPVQMWLAATHYGMSVEESWLGVTVNAARVLGREDIGRIAPGCLADLALWNCESPHHVPYHYGHNHLSALWKRGNPVALGDM